MDTCKNCKYWSKNRGDCDRIDWGDPGEEIKEGAILDIDADDDQGLHGSLITSPDFGCTLFERK